MINDPDGLREVALKRRDAQDRSRRCAASSEQQHELRLVGGRLAATPTFSCTARSSGRAPAARAWTATIRRCAPSCARDPPTEATAAAARPRADDAALARSAELLAEPELRTWFLTAEDLAPYLEELGSVQDSPLVLNEMQQHDRFDAIITRAIDDDVRRRATGRVVASSRGDGALPRRDPPPGARRRSRGRGGGASPATSRRTTSRSATISCAPAWPSSPSSPPSTRRSARRAR